MHTEGPIALFDACLTAGVGRVRQVSALGADAGAATRYHLSKRAADEHLAGLDPAGARLDWCVLRPSLVLGPGGGSTALFAALAAAPLPIRLGPGTWRVQPIHVDDLTAAVAHLLERPPPLPRRSTWLGPSRSTPIASLPPSAPGSGSRRGRSSPCRRRCSAPSYGSATGSAAPGR